MSSGAIADRYHYHLMNLWEFQAVLIELRALGVLRQGSPLWRLTESILETSKISVLEVSCELKKVEAEKGRGRGSPVYSGGWCWRHSVFLGDERLTQLLRTIPRVPVRYSVYCEGVIQEEFVKDTAVQTSSSRFSIPAGGWRRRKSWRERGKGAN